MPENSFTPQEFSDHCTKIIELIDGGHLGFARLAIRGLEAMFHKTADQSSGVQSGSWFVDTYPAESQQNWLESLGWIVPDGEPCQLRDCRGGLFIFNGRLSTKTEYGLDGSYVGESGEAFWGGTSHSETRDRLIVQPVKFVARGDHA